MPASRSPALALLADFAGDGAKPLDTRALVRVDRDSLDRAISTLQPTVILGLPFCHSLRITCWRDFHPENLAERIPALKALLYARAEVGNASVMERHLRQARVSPELPAAFAPATSSTPASAPATPTPVADDDLLESILDGGDSSAPRADAVDSDFDRMLRAIGREAGSDQDFSGEDARRAAIDQELGQRLRAVLHHPAFQRLEATWTGVRRILRAADEIELRLLDVRLSEIVSDAEASPGKRLLPGCFCVPETGDPLTLDVLFCGFEIAADDTGLVACEHLSDLAQRSGAAVIADLHPSALANTALPPAEWRSQLAVRTHDNITLTTPRVLLRLPYGAETDEVEDFGFEEFQGAGQGFPYLWGSGALAIATAVVRDRARGEVTGEIPDLPLHVFRDAGQTRSVGPTSQLLGEARIDELYTAGLTVLVGIVGGDSARIAGLRSASGRRLIDA